MTPESQRPFRVGLVQMSCSTDPAENLEKAAVKVREAAKAGAQIICLQELFRSQYFCRKEDADLFDLAEPIPGESTAVMAKLAKEHNVPDEMPTPNANGKYLQLHFTVEDPKVFTTKWSATMTYRNVTGNDLDWVESVCAENTFWFPGQESDVPQALKADF